VFLKMNSGMNRLGFTPAAFRSAWARLNALPQVDEISLMTHFSDADGPRGIAHQLAVFEAATPTCPASAACPTAPRCCATRRRWARATTGCAPAS
jgi:alanine racemase